MKMSWVTALTILVLSVAASPALAAGDEKVILRAEDFVVESGWLSTDKAAACHSTTPCGSAYGGCTLWSTTYSDCGDPFCGVFRGCGEDCTDDRFCFGPATRQYRERYRVCFNELGQSCTEYQRTSTVLGCGC